MTSARSIGSLFSFEAFYDFSTNVLHLFKLQLLFDKSVVSSLTLHTRKTRAGWSLSKRRQSLRFTDENTDCPRSRCWQGNSSFLVFSVTMGCSLKLTLKTTPLRQCSRWSVDGVHQ